MMNDCSVLIALLSGKIIVDESTGKEYKLEGGRMWVRMWGDVWGLSYIPKLNCECVKVREEEEDDV